MEEVLFYEQLLDLPDLLIDRVDRQPRRIDIYAHLKAEQQTCPLCGKTTAMVNQTTQRQVRDLDMAGRQVWLHIQLRQFVCPHCDRFFTQAVPFADPAKSYTHRQARWIFECAQHQSFSQTGALLDVQAKTVERIYYQQAATQLDLPTRYAQVRRLGIDEIAHRKGKGDYCCVLTDLDRGYILDILPSRSKKALLAHFQKLGSAFCAQIESVCYDMWTAYDTVAEACFPQAIRVVDRFHVVKLLNEVVDRFRRKLRRDAPDQQAFKSIKWLLFKRKLTALEQLQLDEAFAHSPVLGELLRLRNDFHHQYEHASSGPELARGLRQWLSTSLSVSVKGLTEFGGTLMRWLTPISNYAHSQLTNAGTEGLNNLIRWVKRLSFGLPNFAHLRLRVLAQSL